jgi:energy-coupling factor transport system permease protein
VGKKTMLKDIAIGQYIPGDSVLHKLDPRTKIIAIVLYMIGLFLVNNLSGYLFVTFFTVGLIYLSKIPLITLLKGIRPLAFIIIFTFLLHIFMTEGNILWQWGFLHITQQGLRQGIFMALRLIYLVTITSLLTLTTTPIALTDGVEKVLKALFIPIAHELAMMMTIALRFIPTLIEETEKIMKAQMARGADFESGGLISRAKSLIPLLVPLFLSSFRRADELAIAMEARCYKGGKNRTRMKQLVMTPRDYLAFVILSIFVAFSLYMRYIKI